MPELCPQEQAQQIALLSSWYLYEWRFFSLMADAHFQYEFIRVCMTMEAV